MRRIFHFSEESNIEVFVPRQVKVIPKRKPGYEWLNGPLVWAIDEWHQPMYLFPRDCPRILLWPTPHTTPVDNEHFFGGTAARIIVYVEERWTEHIRDATLFRYELPVSTFKPLNDAGMWVSKETVEPVDMQVVKNLTQVLEDEDVDLRVVESLIPFKDLWNSSLHVSGIRLRNAVGWT